MLELKALWKGEVSPFGCAYNCAIGDTVTAGKPSTNAFLHHARFSLQCLEATHFSYLPVALSSGFLHD